MLRFLSRFQADFWLISEWFEPFDWVGMLRFRQLAARIVLPSIVRKSICGFVYIFFIVTVLILNLFYYEFLSVSDIYTFLQVCGVYRHSSECANDAVALLWQKKFHFYLLR